MAGTEGCESSPPVLGSYFHIGVGLAGVTLKSAVIMALGRHLNGSINGPEDMAFPHFLLKRLG